jgi:type VI secretion system secreted protein VgrG
MSINDISLDVLTFLRTATILAIIGAILSIWTGIRAIRSSRSLPYFRMRREQLIRGWRLVFLSFILSGLSAVLIIYGEPVMYDVYPMTPTPSLTPTITVSPTTTLSPTITWTPTITLTPEVSDTPTITSTAHLPIAIEIQITSDVTPNPEARFSDLTFARDIDSLLRPLQSGTVFDNPIIAIYALFSYENMIDGSQWTALWYRDGVLVHFETEPWDGGTGGLGYSEWQPNPEGWLPGTYQIQIFVGLEWKVVGEFIVEGAPSQSTTTPTHTSTITDTSTITPTSTRWPTLTRTPELPTPTQWPTYTRTPTPPRPTPYPTYTRTPKLPKPTSYPTLTRTVTITSWPTVTKTLTLTPTATPTVHITAEE